jgi:hypothetical protein
MPYDQQFGVFREDEQGPLWNGSFTHLDEAKQKARTLAESEGCEFFIYNFQDFTEIARFFPSRPKPKPQPQSNTSRQN